MSTRREFAATAASLGGMGLLQACSDRNSTDSYAVAARNIWRHTSDGGLNHTLLMRELVRYATLAPSSHNTQCWKFRVEDGAISILPDFIRRCPAVDPDDHHLFVSLGCATENLVQAALAHGLQCESDVRAEENSAIRLSFNAAKPVSTPLFLAIPERQSTRAEYDGKSLSADELQMLERAGTDNGVRVLLFTERNAMEKILEYVVQANSAQMADAAFMRELKMWIRFNGSEALRTEDGLYSATSGNPSVPSWLGRLMFSTFFKPSSENDKYAKHVRSSAGIAVFVSETSDRAHWIAVGRSYERFALQSAALGIRNAFLNQPVEVARLRPQFATFLGLGSARVDLVVRFGRGPKVVQSLRRPVTSVLA